MAYVLELVTAFIALAFLFVKYRKWSHKYWARRNVPYIEPHLIWGNMENPFRSKHGIKIDIKNSYDYFKRQGDMHGGIFFTGQPIYIPVDLNLIKNIVLKDFQNFIGHGLDYDKKKDPLSGHIFNLDGEDWRNMRVKLTPTFTSGKMKMMFNNVMECGIPLMNHIDTLCENKKSLDLKTILSFYTTDVIGSCAFGIECNSFKEPNSEFLTFGRKLFEPSKLNVMKMFLMFFLPQIKKIFYFRSFPLEIENFYMKLMKDLMDYRKANNVKRNDFVHLFMEMQEKAKLDGEVCFTLQEIVAQVFVFFLAGFETSSTTMSFCLHELAFNQDIQDKLRKEIRETMQKNGGNLTYDGIMEMKYMDLVVNETLRKYPIVPFVMRECSIDYKVPNTDLTIEKDTKVFISTLGIHRDEEYYPNPEKFDPERFTEENKGTRPQFAYIPFGEGPRICIGMRFGLMQTKAAISMLLNDYKFTPTKGDSYKVNFEARSFNLAREGPMEVVPEKL